jgi:hypothetical protein
MHAARSSCQVCARVVAGRGCCDLRVKRIKYAGIAGARPWCCGGLAAKRRNAFSNIWARVDVGTIRGTWPANWLFASLSLTHCGTCGV